MVSMTKQLSKMNPIILENLKVIFSSKKSIFSSPKVPFQTKLVSKAYIQDVVISLICHQKVTRSSSNKFWVYEGFVYHSLLDFINNDLFLNKIAEIREYFSILGSQFLSFDPLFQNIIFLPLQQQKIIYESALIQSLTHSPNKNLNLFDKVGNFSLEQFQLHQNSFQSALVLVLAQKLEYTTSLLNFVTEASRGTLLYFPHPIISQILF